MYFIVVCFSLVVCLRQLTAAKPAKVEVLEHVAALDTENRQAFDKQVRSAMESLEEQIRINAKRGTSSKGDKEAASKKEAEAKEKAPEAYVEFENSEKKQQMERMWGLTPSFLKELLPKGGTLSGEFSAQFHPVNEYFKVYYPCSADLICDCCVNCSNASKVTQTFNIMTSDLS